MIAETRRGPGRPSLSNEALLDIALDLFLAQGFERTSIEAICAAAGMAKRTVYARYGDKQSLFKSALERAIAEWIVPVERLDEAESDDLEASLLAVGHLLVANMMSPAGQRLLRLTNAESGRMPEIGAFNVITGTQPTIAWLAGLFSRRLSQAIDDEEALLAGQAFLNLVVGGPALTSAWGVAIDAASVDRQTRHAVRLFLYGLMAKGPAARSDENAALRGLLKQASAELDTIRARLSSYVQP